MTEIPVGLIGFGVAARVFHAPVIEAVQGLKDGLAELQRRYTLLKVVRPEALHITLVFLGERRPLLAGGRRRGEREERGGRRGEREQRGAAADRGACRGEGARRAGRASGRRAGRLGRRHRSIPSRLMRR